MLNEVNIITPVLRVRRQTGKCSNQLFIYIKNS